MTCPTCLTVERKCPYCLDVYRSSDGLSAVARRIKEDVLGDGYRHDYYDLVEAECERRGVDVLCPTCHGNGDLATPAMREWADNPPDNPIPDGPGWQLWETVGDSPMSPVFASSDELVDWMTSNPWMMNPSNWGPSLVPSSWDVAERFVSVGWAPSLVSDGSTVVDGVTFVV